jgi:hypothetical protein
MSATVMSLLENTPSKRLVRMLVVLLELLDDVVLLLLELVTPSRSNRLCAFATLTHDNAKMAQMMADLQNFITFYWLNWHFCGAYMSYLFVGNLIYFNFVIPIVYASNY